VLPLSQPQLLAAAAEGTRRRIQRRRRLRHRRHRGRHTTHQWRHPAVPPGSFSSTSQFHPISICVCIFHSSSSSLTINFTNYQTKFLLPDTLLLSSTNYPRSRRLVQIASKYFFFPFYIRAARLAKYVLFHVRVIPSSARCHRLVVVVVVLGFFPPFLISISG